MPNDESRDNEKQFPPGLYDLFRSSDSARIARILSLGTVLPTAPGVDWKAAHEHWFTTAKIDLNAYLGAGDVAFKYVANLNSLNAIGAELADPSKYSFQLYAKGVLTPADWTPGVPNWVSPAYYFLQDPLPTHPNKAMRPLFEVDSKSGILTNVTWFTLDNTVTSYFANVTPGTTIQQKAQSTGTIPQAGWYYRSQ